MYLKKKPSKRKTFAPISAKRQKQRRIKIIFLFLFSCLFIFLCFLGLNKGFQYLFEHQSQWFTWKAKTFVIEADDEYTENQIKNMLSFKEGALISGEDAKNLQKTLQSKLAQVQEVQVKRGFFSTKLFIKAKNYEVLAKIQTKDKSYLLSRTGVLFNYEQAQIPSESLQVNLQEDIKGSFLSQELVKLLKDIANNSLPELEYIAVDLKQGTFNLYFKNGSFVAMGLFELYNEKIVALKDIIDIAQKKGFKKPYHIDFTYFRKGKIYLNTQV